MSAADGTGIELLLARIDGALSGERIRRELVLEPTDGKRLAWLYRHATVVSRTDDSDGRIHIEVELTPDNLSRLEKFAG
jgi:GTP-binding protein HflX